MRVASTAAIARRSKLLSNSSFRNLSCIGRSAMLSAIVAACGACALETSEPSPPDVDVQGSALQEWIRDRVYVLSSDAATSHAPTGSFSYNSEGGENYVERTGTGKYVVHSQWINDSGGNVQVVAYGNDAARCKVAGWANTSSRYPGNLAVTVRCHGTNGLAADSRFALHFLGSPWGRDAGDAAYVWTSTTATHTVNSAYAFNGGGPIEFVRVSTGVYFVEFYGLTFGAADGSVQVTAYGSGPEYCTINNDPTVVDYSGTSDDFVYVTVNCFNNSGVRVDSLFTLLLLTDHVTHSDVEFAYLYADQSTNDAYTPDPVSQENTVTGRNGTAGRLSRWDPTRASYTYTGSYYFRPDGFTVRVPFVTAHHALGDYCKLNLRKSDEVQVFCFDATGKRQNTRYFGLALDGW
jgi:hypothetical protein